MTLQYVAASAEKIQQRKLKGFAAAAASTLQRFNRLRALISEKSGIIRVYLFGSIRKFRFLLEKEAGTAAKIERPVSSGSCAICSPVQNTRNSRQNKNRQPIRAAVLPILRRRFHSASILAAHRRELSFPLKGHLSSPLPGCQTRFGASPDVWV